MASSFLLHESTPFLVLSTVVNSFVHPLTTSFLYLCCRLIPFVLLSVILLVCEGGEATYILASVAFFSQSLPHLFNMTSYSAIICPQSHGHGALKSVSLFHAFACALPLLGILFLFDWYIPTEPSDFCSNVSSSVSFPLSFPSFSKQ